jgi:dienelactone hydrolase
VALWDPLTGVIDHQAAQAWKNYDLRIILTQNWRELAPRLRGKLHIASGEADQYFLNNAVHLLDQELAHVTPPFTGKIVYGSGQAHGWMDISVEQMLQEMFTATRDSAR